MARRFRPMTAADLAALPQPCAGSASWASGPGDLIASAAAGHGALAEQEWAEAVTRNAACFGVAAYNDAELIGHLVLAPAPSVSRLAAFASAPAGPDAAVLLSVAVAEQHRGHGVGRHLVQSAAALAARRDLRALEAVGSPQGGSSCRPPVAWLERVGFVVVRPHPVTPRLRMDLQTTQRWRPDLGAAWSRLTGLVTQPAATEPATYTSREAAEPLPSPAP